MRGVNNKIFKLIKALELKGHIYLYNKEQVYSNKANKVFTLNKLFNVIPVDKYNKLYPNRKKDAKKYKYVKVEVLSTFRTYEILLKLVEIYSEVNK